MPNKNKFYNNVVKNNGKKKLKPSFWVVLFLMIFWTIASVLTVFLTVKDCNSVSAAENSDSEVIEIQSILDTSSFVSSQVSWNNNICTVSFKSTSVLALASFPVISSETYTLYASSFSTSWGVSDFCVLQVGSTMYNSPEFIFSDLSQLITFTPQFSGTAYLRVYSSIIDTFSFSVGVFEADVNDSELQNSIYYAIGKLDGASENYQNGYKNGYEDGLNNISSSLGIFKYATFSYGLSYSNNDSYSDISYITFPANGIVSYYNGFYIPFSIFDDDNFLVGSSSGAEGGFLKLDFGINGIDISNNLVFNVNFYSSGNILNTTPGIGISVKFIFLDNTSFSLSTSDGNFSSIDIRNYKTSGSFFLKFIIIECERIDIRPIGFSTDSVYFNAYEDGFNSGLNLGHQNGYTDGYNQGKLDGYNNGYNAGSTSAGDYTFLSLLGSVVDAPIQAISGLLNFNLLGFNMLSFFTGLITVALILFVIRLFI